MEIVDLLVDLLLVPPNRHDLSPGVGVPVIRETHWTAVAGLRWMVTQGMLI